MGYIGAEQLEQVRQYGLRMNLKEKNLWREEAMWSKEIEQEFLRLVAEYGNNCRKFELIARELEGGKFSKEFLRDKKMALNSEGRSSRHSRKNRA